MRGLPSAVELRKKRFLGMQCTSLVTSPRARTKGLGTCRNTRTMPIWGPKHKANPGSMAYILIRLRWRLRRAGRRQRSPSSLPERRRHDGVWLCRVDVETVRRLTSQAKHRKVISESVPQEALLNVVYDPVVTLGSLMRAKNEHGV